MDNFNTNSPREPRYADLRSDAGFKAVFGDRDNKQVLITLLNLILPPNRRVADLEYLDREIPGFSRYNKTAHLDLRCSSPDGSSFIVEMQKKASRNFFRRCVSYCSRVYDADSSRGEPAYDISPVYLIAILVEPPREPELRTGHEAPVSHYLLSEKSSHAIAPDTINIIFPL